jgi:hemerythrin
MLEHRDEEEKLMKEIRFPDDMTKDHTDKHETLLAELKKFREKMNSEKISVYELELFMNNWLVKHILEEDKKCQPYFMEIDRKTQ